ncbi:MAG: Crp/Fnr family transcriptional regulator [Betaproteobacteria bacterium]|nr:Crp/Fnr family transcriptional regulator [Betaproteobacteria bacterium]
MATVSEDEKRVFEATPWFGALPLPLRQRIFDESTRLELADGDRLYARGEAADGWYGLLSGAIKVGNLSSAGDELVLAYVEPGNWLGELSLIDGLPRSHDGHAQGATTVLRLPPARFTALMEEYPPFARAMLEMQAKRIRMMFAAIEDLNLLPLDARLAKQLLSLAKSYGRVDGDCTEIALHLPQEELARLLGASRQRVNRELKAFERQGILSARYGRLRLRNVADLERISRRV